MLRKNNVQIVSKIRESANHIIKEIDGSLGVEKTQGDVDTATRTGNVQCRATFLQHSWDSCLDEYSASGPSS